MGLGSKGLAATHEITPANASRLDTLLGTRLVLGAAVDGDRIHVASAPAGINLPGVLDSRSRDRIPSEFKRPGALIDNLETKRI
ncbi:MAG TPA: hypothetical protein VFQ05_00525 [Candidatus Eisenbacteria bacterium]|nr:hypothetical protein [Candidatus Eisenbacteria bacterium]